MSRKKTTKKKPTKKKAARRKKKGSTKAEADPADADDWGAVVSNTEALTTQRYRGRKAAGRTPQRQLVGYAAQVDICGTFVFESDARAITDALRRAGYRLRKHDVVQNEDGVVMGNWTFTRDVYRTQGPVQ